MSAEGQIAAGYYKGRAVAGSEQYATGKNGTEQVAIDVGIPSLNRTYTTFLYFSDAAAPFAIERLRACGWKGDDIANLSGIDANEIDVQIKYEAYQGQDRMKVEIATGGGRVKLENQMDERAKRAFAARMKAMLKNGGNGAAPANSRQAPSSTSTDDEIPF